jgi:hypothetical protein
MNFAVGNLVSVRIDEQLVKARVVEFITNNNILVELIGASYYGQRIISISSSDIIRVLDEQIIHNPSTDTTNKPNINSIIPTALSQSAHSMDNHIRDQSFPGGQKSRRNRLKKKHSKRY